MWKPCAPTALFVMAFVISVRGQPDLILHNGKIVAVDEGFTIHEAMAVSGERITGVGKSEEVLKLKGADTKIIDLQKKTVLPGLIDSHTHPLGAALIEFDHELPTMETIDDVLDYIRGRAKVVAEGEWIVLQQVFITRLREQRYPSRDELDKAAPKHPVAFRTGPDASLNSLALQKLKIDREFKIPEGVAGRIEKTANGEPTGILRNVANYVKIPEGASARQPSREEKLSRLKALFADYNAVGITSICDRNASPEALELYQQLHKTGQLTVRAFASHQMGTSGSVSNIQENIRKVAAHRLFKEKGDWVRIIGIKTFLDGGMLTGSAYMREPWGVSKTYGIDDPHYRGLLFIPKDKLLPVVQTAVESGLQFTAHSVGDGAVHTLVEVYEEIARERPIRQTRPCVTHCNFMSKEVIAKMAEVGVAADIQPAWLYLDAHTLEKQFGYERLRWFQPLKSLFEAGVVIGGGSDHMQKIGSLRSINFYDPWLAIRTAVHRRPQYYPKALHPEEALTPEQALRFYTANNAWLLFAEQKIGSLETGKLADFIIVEPDPLTRPREDIRNIRVLKTYVAGKEVFGRN